MEHKKIISAILSLSLLSSCIIFAPQRQTRWLKKKQEKNRWLKLGDKKKQPAFDIEVSDSEEDTEEKEKKNFAEKGFEFAQDTLKHKSNFGKGIAGIGALGSFLLFPTITKLALLGTFLYATKKLVLDKNEENKTFAQRVGDDWEKLKNFIKGEE